MKALLPYLAVVADEIRLKPPMKQFAERSDENAGSRLGRS